MDNDRIVTQAFDIIVHAGDGRTKIMEAFDAIAESCYEKAETLLKEAHKEIVLAHNAQTVILQGVAAEEYPEIYSVLFTHAQDTLMTIYSEYHIAIKMLAVAKNLESKINESRKEN